MYTRLFVLLFPLLYILTACSAPAATPTAAPTSVPPPSATTVSVPTATVVINTPRLTPAPTPRALAFGKSYLDVHYCTDGTLPLKLNIVVPNASPYSPIPVLIHLKYQSDLIRPLVSRGFIVADVPYREPPEYKLPIAVADVKCAIRYLRANAAKYNLDPTKIGVFGCSRGGHVAAMLGVTDPSADMEGSPDFSEQSSQVQAVEMFDGIANFRTNYFGALDALQGTHGIASFDDPLVARLSPITYATQGDAPFLIIASESDHWRAQAQEIKNALDANQVPVTYVPAEGATHCNFSEAGPNTKEKMTKFIGDFFERVLK